MELNEALRRIVVRHAWILLAFMIIGLTVPFAVAGTREPVYRASARVALGGWDPNDSTKAKTLVDSARAVATSDRVVAEAIKEAGVTRSVADVASTMSVSAPGSTSVVDVVVTDRDPVNAAKLADALAKTMISVRSELVRGQIQSLVADVDQRMAAVDGQIRKLEAAARAAAIGSQRAEVAIRQYDAAIRQRASLENERGQLLSLGALQPRAAVIDGATVPTSPAGQSLTASAILGAIAGLLVGLAVAALLEVLRPTVSGADAISRAAGGPWLGTLPASPGPGLNGQLEAAVGGIRLAAASAKTGTVLVVPAGTEESDADLIAVHLLTGVPKALSNGHTEPEIGPLPGAVRAVVAADRADQGGIVVIAPDSLRRSDLAGVHHWQAVTGWPVLGVLLFHKPRRWRSNSPISSDNAYTDLSLNGHADVLLESDSNRHQ